LGFVTSVTFIFVVGIFMSSWLGASVLSLGEWFIKHQNSRAFQEVVIIKHPRAGEYAFGFITSSFILLADNILEKFKVIFKGKVYMARAKELFAWTPIFLDHKESEYISDDESLYGAKNKSVGSQHGEDDLVDDSDVEGVSETFFGDKHPSPNNSVCNSNKVNSPLVPSNVMNNSQE
nr:protein like COV 1-like [Tanacetum cinerariifolium]